MVKVKTIAGFDVSKAHFDVCINTVEGCQEKRFSYDNEGMSALLKWLPGEVHCVMEATGPYSLKLACYLYEHKQAVSVVNPLVIKRFSQMRLIRTKTDKADARMIAAYGIAEQPALWRPPAAYMIKVQQLEALLQQFQKQRTALLCQQEAFAASAMQDKEVKQIVSKALANLDKQIERVTTMLEKIIETHHGQMMKHVVSIPGVGKKTAIVLIALSAGFSRFRNYKQLSAYVGLSPRVYQSGTSVKGKGRICKMGMSRIRAMLYVCAWSAKRCNKACKELYERLIANGKAKRLALIAVANKLIKQVFAIATKQTTYQSDYSENICF